VRLVNSLIGRRIYHPTFSRFRGVNGLSTRDFDPLSSGCQPDGTAIFIPSWIVIVATRALNPKAVGQNHQREPFIGVRVYSCNDHSEGVWKLTDKLRPHLFSECIVNSRRPALEVGGSWGSTNHSDQFMNTEKIVGQEYPAECLVDSKTGLPVMIRHTEDSDRIRQLAKASAENLLRALRDETGLTPI